MSIYQATAPAGLDRRDIVAAATAALPIPADLVSVEADGVTTSAFYSAASLTPQQVTAWQTAVSAIVANANAPWAVVANLTAKGTSALAGNITYLAIPSPNAAQVAAQVNALTRQVDGILRLLLGLLNTTDGT